VLIGTGAGADNSELDNVVSFGATTLLVQTGAVANGDNFDIAITKASAWSSEAGAQGVVAVNLTGTSVADTLTTGAKADTISGGAGSDTITGGAGADSITGGDGNDLFNVAASSTLLAIAGTGNSGTITGFDTITDFRLGSASLVAESLDMTEVTEAVVANTTGADGADSTLTIDGATVKSHAITSGIVTFDDAGTFATALTLTSAAHLAAVVQYLQANDLGDAGATVAFVVGSDTYVFMQGDNGGTDSADVLVKLTGVTGTSVSTTNAATVGLIDIGG
jgi:Ca2+-binding RTX toxin-like protein